MELDQPIILTNATLATLAGPSGYGLIRNGAVAVIGQTIAFVGQSDAIPGDFQALPRLDLEGRLVTPGPIDCHTHIVHAGHRAREFEMRLDGATYEEVARAGGGIVSSVRATREASEDALVASALPRLDALIGEGVTTVEIKSGYGLEIGTELKMLRAARRLGRERKVRVRTTYLGAHAVPAEYKGRTEAYLTEVCLPGLEAAAAEGLVDAVDGFCEGIAFSVEDMTRVFDAAKRLGLPVKLHAEQLSRIGGTQLAARYGALSADHVEYATDEDAAALAKAGTVAVLLPGAFYAIRETQVPPVAAFRAHGVPMALATDCNPGTSPLTSLLLTMNMGCTFFRLTVEEALRGVTVNAARALGLEDCGRIAEGLRADLAIWNVETPAELVYRFGFNPLHARVFGGSQ
ncbi:imidazolonepropionase [Pannonibacter tanglangensis]|uniref:Imidazolonepropionase n=1 Tax=Pannonibacter tanglangensis TaxID=2750084 RepID=A0ABW9ZIV1_9HYPH|nr:imidazolonepropionase [Pannonibacter sp. XCT-34]NBN63973.1 imidazolonepropionase [Pannonibacter sp. XCT-34]